MYSFDISSIMQRYLKEHHFPVISPEIFNNKKIISKYYALLLEQMHNWFAGKLNPFNLCPSNLTFWFMVPPLRAIGVSITGLRQVNIFWRQQIDPNETIYVMFKIFELHPPFPLTMLLFSSALGLTLVDGAYRVVEAVREEFENTLKKLEEKIDGLYSSIDDLKETFMESVTEEEELTRMQRLDPFNLTPRMSVYFPVYGQIFELGFLTIDFRHSEISIKQFLDPKGMVVSLIRFIDVYSPFPMQISVMILSIGLFLTGKIYEYNQSSQEEILREVKRSLKNP